MKLLIACGAGFIESALIRHILKCTTYTVINFDKWTYAGNLESLVDVDKTGRYFFEHVDICDADQLRHFFDTHKLDAVMHLAAESHVDRSINGPAEFIKTNVNGTFNLFEAARQSFKVLIEWKG